MTLIDPHDRPPARPANDRSGTILLLNLVGFACLALGLYYLVWEPANPGGDGSDVTLHRLVIGQTAILAGAIFLAAAWRPR